MDEIRLMRTRISTTPVAVMTSARAWSRHHTAVERKAIEIIVDKLLDAKLGVPGRDSAEQRENTRTWAEVFFEALIEDRKAAELLAEVLLTHVAAGNFARRSRDARKRLVKEGVLDERSALIADIRARLPIVAVGYPDLAADIGKAMDVVEAKP